MAMVALRDSVVCFRGFPLSYGGCVGSMRPFWLPLACAYHGLLRNIVLSWLHLFTLRWMASVGGVSIEFNTP